MLQLLEKPRDEKWWDRFLEIGLPTKESEVYRYVSLKELYSRPFHLSKPFQPQFEPEKNTLVFVNGAYCAALSSFPSSVIALPLSQAFATYGNFLNPRLHKHLKEEKDPFVAINAAYYSEGLFLYLPPKTHCEAPLKIVHLIDNIKTPTLLPLRIHVFAGKGSSAKLFFLQQLTSVNVWVNAVMDIALEENAHLSFATTTHQQEMAHDFLALRATLKEKSQFKSIAVTNGGATSRQDYAVHLLGSHAEAALYGVWGLKSARQHHVNVWMNHQQPNCTSLQKFKGILDDTSRSSFEGKIYVHSCAQKTEAYQMNNNLILGERSSAYSKPNLEIFADDVKASHGATVGQLDPEQLFYFLARGVPKKKARELLIHGFSQEIIDCIEDQYYKERACEALA